MAQFEDIPRQPGAEAVIAIVGPIVSFVLGILCWLGLRATPENLVSLRFVLAYLCYMNIVVAVFNLIPALPMDGGRVLRSLLALAMPHPDATRAAAAISKGLALLMGLFGLFSLNFFLLLIAVFIYMAVSAENAHHPA